MHRHPGLDRRLARIGSVMILLACCSACIGARAKPAARDVLDPLDEGKPDLAPPEIWRDYMGLCTYVDYEIGRLLAALRALGLDAAALPLLGIADLRTEGKKFPILILTARSSCVSTARTSATRPGRLFYTSSSAIRSRSPAVSGSVRPCR